MTGSTQAHFAAILRSALQSTVSDDQIAALWQHYELLQRWNRVLNLTSIDDFEQVVLRHYGESVLSAKYVPRGTFRLVDVGSGAGFPGIPIAVIRKEIEVTLVESSQRKAAFLRECTDLAPNLKVVTSRADSIDAHFDILTARAVALRDVLPLIPGLAPAFVLLLGASDAQQITLLNRFRCEPPAEIPWSDQTVILSGRAVVA
jgi:16S rRNA (guanine527-N7)-methyltransferase